MLLAGSRSGSSGTLRISKAASSFGVTTDVLPYISTRTSSEGDWMISGVRLGAGANMISSASAVLFTFSEVIVEVDL